MILRHHEHTKKHCAVKTAIKNNSSNPKNKPEPISEQQIDHVEKQNRRPQSKTGPSKRQKNVSRKLATSKSMTI